MTAAAEIARATVSATNRFEHETGNPRQSRPGLAPRFAGLWVVRASSPAPRANGASPSIAKSRNLKTAASKKRSVKSSATARRKVTSAATAAKVPPKSDEPKVERVTKQERLLTLLSQAEGRASRDDAGNRLAAAQRARVFGGR
jgi:hypothetical protein